MIDQWNTLNSIEYIISDVREHQVVTGKFYQLQPEKENTTDILWSIIIIIIKLSSITPSSLLPYFLKLP